MMNADFKPEKMLVVFKNQNSNHYIEVHDFISKGNDFIAGPGRPITKEAMRKIISVTYEEQSSDKYWSNPLIDEGILMFIPEKFKREIMWWRPAKTVYMRFTESSKMKDGKINMPAMLFHLKSGKLKLFALDKDERPNLYTALYFAPLFNMTGENLCWGSVRTNTEEIIEVDTEIKQWESFIWNSLFAHAGTVNVTKKTEIVTLYKKLLDSGKNFPIKELVKTGKSLKDLLRDGDY